MIEAIVAALDLPATARVERRVPKSLLVEHGTATSADRRAVESGIERIDWVASLKPGTIGVAAYSDETREAGEIAVLTAHWRTGAKAARLTTLLHRAIPYPILLVAGEGTDAATLSLGPKRYGLGKGSGVVVEMIVSTPPVTSDGDAVQAAFMDSLAIARLPRGSLWLLYMGLIERAEAFAAARAGGFGFELPADVDQAETRRAALIAHAMAVRSLAQLRIVAARERQVARAVDLAGQVADAKAAVARACTALKMDTGTRTT